MMESHNFWLFPIILYSYKLYYCQIYLPYLWHFATLFLCTWLHPINMPENISDCLSCYLQNISSSVKLFHLFISNVNLVFELGNAFMEPLFGTPMMATLGSFPKIQIFQTCQTFQTKSKRQNRAGNHTYCPCYFSH